MPCCGATLPVTKIMGWAWSSTSLLHFCKTSGLQCPLLFVELRLGCRVPRGHTKAAAIIDKFCESKAWASYLFTLEGHSWEATASRRITKDHKGSSIIIICYHCLNHLIIIWSSDAKFVLFAKLSKLWHRVLGPWHEAPLQPQPGPQVDRMVSSKLQMPKPRCLQLQRGRRGRNMQTNILWLFKLKQEQHNKYACNGRCVCAELIWIVYTSFYEYFCFYSVRWCQMSLCALRSDCQDNSHKPQVLRQLLSNYIAGWMATRAGAVLDIAWSLKPAKRSHFEVDGSCVYILWFSGLIIQN